MISIYNHFYTAQDLGLKPLKILIKSVRWTNNQFRAKKKNIYKIVTAIFSTRPLNYLHRRPIDLVLWIVSVF